VGLWRTAFPDVQYKVEDEVVAGDAVVQRVTCSGTHLGEFQHMMGTLPPTGKRFSVDQIHIQRFANGKLVEHWGTRNDLAMYQQLGLIAKPEPPTMPAAGKADKS
jgi:predicted ester cyclase